MRFNNMYIFTGIAIVATKMNPHKFALLRNRGSRQTTLTRMTNEITIRNGLCSRTPEKTSKQGKNPTPS